MKHCLQYALMDSPESSPSPAAFAETHSPSANSDYSFRLRANSLCPELADLANVFTKNTIGFSRQAKAQFYWLSDQPLQPKAPIYLVEPYLALSFVKNQAFVPEDIRHIVPVPCLTFGPFSSNVKGMKLSCTLSTDTTAPVYLAAASSKWNVSLLSAVYKTFPGVWCLPNVGPDVGNGIDGVDHCSPESFQDCGSFTGLSSNGDAIYARVGHGQGNVVSRFVSISGKRYESRSRKKYSINGSPESVRCFIGQKDIRRAGSYRNSLNVDAERLQHFAREAPIAYLCGVQFVTGLPHPNDERRGTAALFRISHIKHHNDGHSERCSLKLPFFWNSARGAKDFSFSLGLAQQCTFCFANYQHTCHLGFGLKIKNWDVWPKFYYWEERSK
jgi:hypothetical protein